MRTDLNDLAYFAEVVGHGGFAAAGRALREPKSKLSRRIAALEKRLGLRLIERSSRRFRVTDTGQAFYERCRALLAEAEQAEALVMQAQVEPHGRVRFSCPTGLVEPISSLVASFLARYPKVRLQLVATDRAVDLIEERIDLALRVRSALTSDAALTMRSLGLSNRILVASPQVARRVAGLEQLAELPLLATTDAADEVDLHLEAEDGRTHVLRGAPRLGCADMAAVRTAAAARARHRDSARSRLPRGAGGRAPRACAPRLAGAAGDRASRLHDEARPSAGRPRLDRSSGRRFPTGRAGERSKPALTPSQ